MNKVVLIGRLTADPKVTYSQGENSMAIARYTLAVDRRGKDAGADFIGCVSFSKAAEFAEKYYTKGIKIAIEGRIQTGSYTNKEGQKVYTTDVIVDAQEFVEKKGAAETAEKPKADKDGFMAIPDGCEDDGLPFN